MTVETEVQGVVYRRITSMTVYNDSNPIPMMKNKKNEPIDKKMNAEPTMMETFLDLGCQETLVSVDLMDYLRLELDTVSALFEPHS